MNSVGNGVDGSAGAVASKRRSRALKPLWVVLFVLAVGLVSGGVFASTQITINGGSAVNLGAGAQTVRACSQNATVSTEMMYDPGAQIYGLSTVSLQIPANHTCAGKTLALAFKAGSTTYSTTWSVANNTNAQTFTYGISPGVNVAENAITTIAISAQ